MDCSHILGDSLAVIINEEKHPKPEDCHGVDYAEIYRYINSLMNGDLPKQPNEVITYISIYTLRFLFRPVFKTTTCIK